MTTLFFRKVEKGLKGLVRLVQNGYPIKLNRDKKDLLDFTFTMIAPNPQSFADLGGVWGITVLTLYTHSINTELRPLFWLIQISTMQLLRRATSTLI